MNKSEKCSSTQIGRKVIHLGEKEQRVYEDELSYYLSLGWELGQSDSHKKNNSNSHKEKPSKLKGVPKSKNHKDSVSKTLKSKYYSGELTVWNKGLTALTDERVKKNSYNSSMTKMYLYGSCFPDNNMNDEHKKKISDALKGRHPKPMPEEKLILKTTKQYLTRKKNNTFNTSMPENELYESLLNDYEGKTILKQYKDSIRYPFYCDFYIVEDDLFIELNAHWTHGGMPFDKNNQKCIEQLSVWEEKAKTSKFYQQAIETWTIRDVKKLQYAEKYNLNYKAIY